MSPRVFQKLFFYWIYYICEVCFKTLLFRTKLDFFCFFLLFLYHLFLSILVYFSFFVSKMSPILEHFYFSIYKTKIQFITFVIFILFLLSNKVYVKIRLTKQVSLICLVFITIFGCLLAVFFVNNKI